ncbi:MAG: hypothetical protein HY926_11440 [Elusimicrobia bacterium]|nr:hypothetical protein [Elusimicrobiota bacterium]
MRRVLQVLALSASTALCGAAGCAALQPPPCNASGAGPIDVSGEWKSNWGPVWLTQEGDSVTGEYYANRSGKLEGTLAGTALDFRWTEPRMRPGEGRFSFCPDNMSYSGYWGAQNAWHGTRVGTPPAPPAARPVKKAAEARADAEERPATRAEPPPEKPRVYKPDASWDSQLAP